MIWLQLLLVTVAPWFVQLFISPVEFIWLNQPVSSLSEFFRNLSFYTSADFIFFSGDSRLAFSTQEFGLVYLSWLPFLITGLVQSISQNSHRLVAGWLILGLVIASLFTPIAPFSQSLLFLPAAQILVNLGLVHLLTHFRRYPIWLQLGIICLILFSLYEIANFFHVLTLHYPQRIHEAI